MQTEHQVVKKLVHKVASKVVRPIKGTQGPKTVPVAAGPAGFPKATLAQLEEVLEERQLPDRRVLPCALDAKTERRVQQRRSTDRS